MTRALASRKLAAWLVDGTLDATHLPDGTAVILDARSNRVITLSDTAAFIIARLQSEPGLEVHALSEQMAASFKVDRETAARHISELVDGLVQALDAADSNTSGT